MILYTLHCPADHRFEAWFKDSAAFERQAKRGLISCPVCQSAAISRAPMAPRIAKGVAKGVAKDIEVKEQSLPQPNAVAAQAPAEGGEMAVSASPELMNALRQVVEQHCENVGERFAEEARRIHYGETPERGIYGRSTPAETEALLEEGIEVLPLPWPNRNA